MSPIKFDLSGRNKICFNLDHFLSIYYLPDNPSTLFGNLDIEKKTWTKNTPDKTPWTKNPVTETPWDKNPA